MPVEFRDATALDYKNYFGKPPANNFRGVVATIDGRIIGIGGIIYENVPKAFMDYLDEAAGYKKAMVRGAHLVFNRMRETCKMCYAVADDDNKAEIFLFHFGFEFSHYAKDGAIFKWRMQ